MTLETDLILDRRRLKRRLILWRSAAVAAVAVAALLAARPALPGLRGPHLARLNVTGIITDDRKLVEAIDGVAKDNSIPALIVSIDSPGGSVAGGESLHDAIARVAARKPVVAVMRGTAASAGYMVALPAARIFAREATLTGSIGVLLETPDASGLLGKLGVQVNTLVSGPLKDQPSLTHPTSPEGTQVLQGIVADLYGMFVDMVAAGRHMDADKVRGLADGRAYTGRQAKALGLIDEFGGEPEARAWLAGDQHVSATLPVRDLHAGDWRERALGASLGSLVTGLLRGAVEATAGAGTPSGSFDGAWALWQPARTGM